MAYIILTGQIVPGFLYVVVGTKSILYNGNIYTNGQRFRGISGVAEFVYTGIGTSEVNEVSEIRGATAEMINTAIDHPISFLGETGITGIAIEMALNDDEKLVNEVTKISGMAAELIDYPFYTFEIIETRL